MLGDATTGAVEVQPVQHFVGLDGFGLAVLGAIAGLLALALSFWQLARTQRALVAARKAIEATQEGLAMNLLLTLIPKLQEIETDLDDAVENDDKKAGRQLLASWRSTAGEVLGVLAGDPARRRDDTPPRQTRRERLAARLAELVGYQRDGGGVQDQKKTEAQTHPADRSALEGAVRRSIAQAAVAKSRLLQERYTCEKATDSARKAIASACELANEFAANLKTYSLTEGHD
jgi:hypothetical protein